MARPNGPSYVRRLPPCNDACPAGEDIQRWLYEAESGGDGYERAWRALVRENPFPAVMGRVCFHPCETACNRCQLDEAVGINSVERFLGDEAIRLGWQLPAPGPASGRRVLVVGAGPCGLSAAYHLALRGHHVTVRDGAEEPGGMLRYGIPAYRLPRDGAGRRDRADPRARRRAALRRAGDRSRARRCARAASTRSCSRSARSSRAKSRSRAARPPT